MMIEITPSQECTKGAPAFRQPLPLGYFPVDLLEYLLLAMTNLREAADEMTRATGEIVSVATHCSVVRAAALKLSLAADDMPIPTPEIEPLAEVLYGDALKSLAALSRTGRHTEAAIAGIRSTGELLQQLAARCVADPSADCGRDR